MHPLEPIANIQQTLVARGSVLFSAKFAQIKIAHQPETVIGCDHNHIPGARQVSAILIAGAAGPCSEPAAMAVKHDWPFASIGRWAPDIQEQAILIRRR